MNSKNNFRRSAAFIVFITIQHILFAQTFQYSSQKFNISLPSLSITNPNQTTPLPYYTLFIETGDGRYYKDVNHILSASASSPYQIFYDKAIPSGSNAILNIVGHYDTIKPPRELYTFPPVSGYGATDASPQVTLPSGKNIGFAYADKTVVLGDTMTYVVTYKPDLSAYTIVAFFYNDNNLFGRQKVFNEITTTDQSYPFVVADGSTTSTHKNITAIRVKEATPSISIPDGIPSGVADHLTSAGSNFSNAIYFVMPPSSLQETNERNAFISMIGSLDSNLIGSFANIKAVLIKYDKITGYMSQDTVTDALPIDRFASDPNGIRTTPHCLNDSSGYSFHKAKIFSKSLENPFNRPINYDITFRNDGGGDAKHVEVTVLVPEGIQLSPFMVLNVKSIVSRKSIVFYQKPLYPKALNTYEIITKGIWRKIVFNMTDINLPGVSTSQAAKKDFLLREGTISFTLNTIADPHNPSIADDKLSCMYSDVSIVFTSSYKTGSFTNTPITSSDLIRKNCSLASPLPPPCPRKLLRFAIPPVTK